MEFSCLNKLEEILKPFLMNEVTIQTQDKKILIRKEKLYTFFLKNGHVYLFFNSTENNKEKINLELPLPFNCRLLSIKKDSPYIPFLPEPIDLENHNVLELDYQIKTFKSFYPVDLQEQIQFLLDNFLIKNKKITSFFYNTLIFLSCPKTKVLDK